VRIPQARGDVVTIIINPGSGPVSGATRENAEANMAVYITDLKEGGFTKAVDLLPQPDAPEDRGRWTFSITADKEVHEIEMPGLPVDEVRWMDREEQNIWDFPRLYVDGSSWVWFYALRSTMNDLDDEDES
jgi:hypothetical protein